MNQQFYERKITEDQTQNEQMEESNQGHGLFSFLLINAHTGQLHMQLYTVSLRILRIMRCFSVKELCATNLHTTYKCSGVLIHVKWMADTYCSHSHQLLLKNQTEFMPPYLFIQEQNNIQFPKYCVISNIRLWTSSETH